METIRQNESDQILRRTHEETMRILVGFNPILEKHREDANSLRAQAGIEIMEQIREFIERAGEEMPERIRIPLGNSRTVDFYPNDWTFFFGGATRKVNASDCGDIWLDHREVIVRSIEKNLIASRRMLLD